MWMGQMSEWNDGNWESELKNPGLGGSWVAQ